MFSTKTKENLIEIISLTLMENLTAKKIETKLAITSKEEFSVETKLGVRLKRRDLKPLFDEKDCILPHQVDCAVKEDHNSIRVIGSYTDVFVSLCTMYIVKNWSNIDVYTEDFIGEKRLISIRKTEEKHKTLIPLLLAVHVLTGCYTADFSK